MGMNNALALWDETPALMAAMGCALAAGLLTMLVNGAAPQARRTALAAGMFITALAWAAALASGVSFGRHPLMGDAGMMMVCIMLSMLLAIMGGIDRARPLGLLLFAIGTTCTLFYIYPALQMLLPAQTVVSALYAVIIVAGSAHLALVANLPPSAARFTHKGERRMQAAPAYTLETAAGIVLTVAFCAVLWRMKAYGGVHTSFHLYSSMLAAIAAAVSAACVTFYRRSPAALNIAMLAMPAGLLAIGMLPMATPLEIGIIAACAGAAVSLTRDGLVGLHIDEPSHSAAALLIPAVLGFIVPGMLDITLLAGQVRWVGALLAAGLLIGSGWRMICQATLGLALSRRAAEEGLDTRYAALGARR